MPRTLESINCFWSFCSNLSNSKPWLHEVISISLGNSSFRGSTVVLGVGSICQVFVSRYWPSFAWGVLLISVHQKARAKEIKVKFLYFPSLLCYFLTFSKMTANSKGVLWHETRQGVRYCVSLVASMTAFFNEVRKL